MRRIIMILAIIALTACGADDRASVSTMNSPVSGAFASDLNTFRTAQGLGTVAPDPRLERAAQAHADDMAQRGYFSHQSPEGRRMSDRIAASGYRACGSAENIAQGQKGEAEVFASWRASAGHRRNMLGRAYANYGLGRSGDTWVLLLARGC